jgi:hypothetical protein
MSNALMFMAGFAACGAVKLFVEGDPWAGLLVAATFAAMHLSRVYREALSNTQVTRGDTP